MSQRTSTILQPTSTKLRPSRFVELVFIFATCFISNSKGDDGFNLIKFDTDSSAVCLDGTPGGYYYRKGTDNVWLIEAEGGGWCVSLSDCLARSKTDLGSSSKWAPTGCPGMDGGSNGMFSNDCTINPYFCNSHGVHMNYCDGGSFASNLESPILYNGTSLYFQGRSILDETLSALLNLGMNEASLVVLKGCSAGGLATILHADYVSAFIKKNVPNAITVAVPDAGFFMDHNNTLGNPSYTPLYEWVAETMNVSTSVNNACVSFYPPEEQWRCFMAQYVAPFVTTPMFLAQDTMDSWQMTNIYQLPCNPYHGSGNCNASELDLVRQYRKDMLVALQPVLSNPIHGGFYTACVQHCHSNIDACYNSEIVQNQSMSQTLHYWIQKTVNGTNPGGLTTVIDTDGFNNPTCTASCSPYYKDTLLL